MRLQKYINEAWYKTVKNFVGKTYEIFVNPSFKEMHSVADILGVRFIADSRNKKVYVWDAYAATHLQAWKKMKGKGNEEDLSFDGIILEGIATKSGSKYKMTQSDQIETFAVDPLEIKKKFKWVNKYIDINEYLNRKF